MENSTVGSKLHYWIWEGEELLLDQSVVDSGCIAAPAGKELTENSFQSQSLLKNAGQSDPFTAR